MTVTGSTSLPIGGRDANFDGGGARARIVDHFTSNGKTNWSKVKQGFFWIVPGKENLKTGYRLGFADIVNGKLTALPHGIFAVAGGHGVTRTTGIPSADKTKIKKKVNTYYRRMKAKFPNDDFDFSIPFPNVKEIPELEHMEIPDVDPYEDEDDEKSNPLTSPSASLLFAELSEKFFSNNATSFADLAAVEAVREAISKVFKTVYDFEMLAYGVARESETPGQLISGLKSLTKEMTDIFSKMKFDTKPNESDKSQGSQDLALTAFINTDDGQEWEIKQKGNVALLKNTKGDRFFYGRFTNNIWDREDEVLITEAHKEFVNYLDGHPDEAPELWDWHEEDTSKTHQACWWDFSDGFLHSIWPVTDQEAQGIKDFMEEFEPGMSHGFQVLERKETDKRQIAKYRTGEASILPLEFAANEWTSFTLLAEQKQYDSVKERKIERQKMFSPDKQRALELLSLGKYKNPLGKASENDAAALDNAGAKRKQIDQTDEEGNKMVEKKKVDDKDQTPVTPVTPPAVEIPPVTPVIPPTDTKTLDALQVSIVEGFDLLSKSMNEKFKAIEVIVQSHEEALKGIKQKKGESPSVAAWVAAQKAESSVGTGDDNNKGGAGSGRKKPGNGQLDDKDPLFGEGPEEEPFEIQGHLLNNL